MALRIAASFLVAWLLGSPLQAQVTTWQIHGPYGAFVTRIVHDPDDNLIVNMATGNGILRSTDGGRQWSAPSVLLGTPVTDIAFAESDARKLYASTAFGLYNSTDRGQTWKLVNDKASSRVAVSPQNASIVYSLSPDGPIVSTDGGATFGKPGVGLPTSGTITALLVNRRDAKIAYALSSLYGVYISADGGEVWKAATIDMKGYWHYAMASDPTEPDTIYVGSQGVFFKTVDGGKTWNGYANNIKATNYLSFAFTVSPRVIYCATSRGISKSSDGGMTWSDPVLIENQVPRTLSVDRQNPPNVVAATGDNVFRSADGGRAFSLANTGATAFPTVLLTTDPNAGSTIYAGGLDGIYRSNDRGATWMRLVASRASALQADAKDPLTLYGVFDGVFRRSTDGGSTWSDFRTGLPSANALGIGVDPRKKGVIFTVCQNAVWRRNGNDPWERHSTGISGATLVGTFAFDPANPSTMFTGSTTVLFRSTDDGDNWSAVTATASGASSVAIDPFDSTHLFTQNTKPTYESHDGGGTWTAREDVAAGTFLFDRARRGRLYYSNASDIRVSDDGGSKWTSIASGIERAQRSIFAIASDGKTLYTAGVNGGVWTMSTARRRAVETH